MCKVSTCTCRLFCIVQYHCFHVVRLMAGYTHKATPTKLALALIEIIIHYKLNGPLHERSEV